MVFTAGKYPPEIEILTLGSGFEAKISSGGAEKAFIRINKRAVWANRLFQHIDCQIGR